MTHSTLALTIPTDTEIQTLLFSEPIHSYSPEEVERFLRDLWTEYPTSRLMVSSPAALIETSATTGRRSLIEGHIAILERTDETSESTRYLLQLLGGPDYESFYIHDRYRFAAMGQSGWSACAGTVGVLNACFVLPDSMQSAYDAFTRAYLEGPCVSYPRPLTETERLARQELAKLLFLANLRRSRIKSGLPDLAFLN